MKQILLLLLCSTFTIHSFSQDLKANEVLSQKQVKQMKVSSTGLLYTIHEQGEGLMPVQGDYVFVHYTGKLENGKTFDSSIDRGEPLMFKMGAGMVIKGWDEGIAMLNEGGKATLYIRSKLAYGDREIPKLVPANSNLIFEVELVKVLHYDTKSVEPITMPSGLKMYKYNATEGALAKNGQKVVAHYKGYLMDGKKFDSSFDRNKLFEFNVGKGQVIKGWDEAFSLLRVGEYATIEVPANLGYGAAGRPGVIPENATLFFDVYLVNIK